jgi:hypothetical protein
MRGGKPVQLTPKVFEAEMMRRLAVDERLIQSGLSPR